MRNRINPFLRPPLLLVSDAMNSSMMGYTKGYSPLIADLAPKGPWLGKSQVMSMSGKAPTDDAGLRGDVAEVFLVPDPPRRADRQSRLVNAPCIGAAGGPIMSVLRMLEAFSFCIDHLRRLCPVAIAMRPLLELTIAWALEDPCRPDPDP